MTVRVRVKIVALSCDFVVFWLLGLEIEGRKEKKFWSIFFFCLKIMFWKMFLAYRKPTVYVTANYAGFSNSAGSTTAYGSARVMSVHGHSCLACSAVKAICKRWPEFSSCGFGSAAISNQLYHWVLYDWLIFKKRLFLTVKRSSSNCDVKIETKFFRMKNFKKFPLLRLSI